MGSLMLSPSLSPHLLLEGNLGGGSGALMGAGYCVSFWRKRLGPAPRKIPEA